MPTPEAELDRIRALLGRYRSQQSHGGPVLKDGKPVTHLEFTMVRAAIARGEELLLEVAQRLN